MYGIGEYVGYAGYNYISGSLFNQYIDTSLSQYFSWTDYTNEIDAGRPTLIHITGHSMFGYGYSGSSTVYVHDTWLEGTHTMTWGGSYSGYAHKSVTCLTPSGSSSAHQITSPTPGSTLLGTTVTFQWTSGAYEYWLYVGSSQGTYDYHNSGSLGSSTSTTVSGLPNDGSTVYVRLWWKVSAGAGWTYDDCTYTASRPSPPEITSPAEDSTLACESQAFHWANNGTPVTEWWLYLGHSQGANDYYDSGSLGTSISSTVMRCWPNDGSFVWARLWYKTGGSWESEDFRYIAPNYPGLSPEITSPAEDSTLACESQAFHWANNGTPVTEWWLYLGSSQGANDYYDSGSLGTSDSHTVTRCWPDDGSSVWARLWYKTGGSWESEDFRYIAPTCTAGGFNSQFNGDASGWEVHYGTWWIASNQWYTTYGDPNYWASVSYDGNFDDFDYQARLWRNGSDIHSNSILIRGTPTPLDVNKDWYSYCAFQYTRNGYYSVWKTVDSTSTCLQSWTYSSAINQEDAWNTLRVVANGSNLYYYINGTLVWSGSDSSLSSGRVGIEMYSDSTSGDQLWVDWATLTAVTSAITDEVSDEQKALSEEANERGGGSKEASSSVY
ncbi:MAG: hypothetical protein C4B58_14005 [Deltaproteobacteria bacterium]|nr:MAG: hypothetical protein C4B58_14005 [Deltaproteobacteria bacterium]